MLRALAAAAICCAALLVPPAAFAATIHYWQFESGAFLNDSVGGAHLTSGLAPAEVAIPPSGRGSTFDDVLTGNGSAADFPSSATGLTAEIGVPTQDFTIELFAHMDAFVSSFGSHLAGPAVTGAGWAWTIQVRHDGFGGSLVDSLVFGVQNPFGTAELMESGIVMQTGKDYFLAVAFDTDGSTGGTATFYVQNLTDGGVLQTVSVAHSTASLAAFTSFGIGGFVSFNGLETDGLIDQVRLSNTALTSNQLLIAPEPSGAALVALGLLAIGWRRRGRTAVR